MPTTLAAIFAILGLAAASSARADDTWRGRLMCPPLPGVSDYPLNVDFELAQAGTALSYHRQVNSANGGASGGVENGSGTIVGTHADVVGHFAMRGASEAIHYAGEISDGHMHLTGEQVWTLQRTSQSYTRPCRADLAKAP